MHLVVGTPMYGGYCCSEYTKSIMALKEMEKTGHTLTGVFVGNESLIQRARNKIAYFFLMTDASHLLFMDGDQSFVPNDIAKMIAADKDIIAGIVPMKGINWDRVRLGVKQGVKDLDSLTGIFNISHLPGHTMSDPTTPFQVKYAGTGYMLIKREVFTRLDAVVKSYNDRGARIKEYFTTNIVDDILLSEDFNFCHMYREMGGEVWVAPWCKVEHFGSYCFKGQYIESQNFDKVSSMTMVTG